MNVNGEHYRTIWIDENDSNIVQVIDQRTLPHQFIVESINTVDHMIRAIRDMHVRGAGLIGAAAGYAMYLAALGIKTDGYAYKYMIESAEKIKLARPTAVNLSWAVDRQLCAISPNSSTEQIISSTEAIAKEIADEDVVACQQIGKHGLELIWELSKKKGGQTVNILTHCNAGWLAFVDYGTATAPIYAAHEAGIDIHVWVDETRPRNQGARLTAWELDQAGIPYSVIVDNVGGHLMQHEMVDMIIVGSDRTTYTGDVANKVGTYLKALAAYDNDIPFYVALPSSTFDWHTTDGIQHIPIEERDADEVRCIQGLSNSKLTSVLLTPETSSAANFAFDVTPARLVTGLITERGICQANENSILDLFPEKKVN